MANFSSMVYDPDTNQLRKKDKQPLVQPNDVYRQDADQPYGFGVPNDQQPVGGNPGTYDLNGSAESGWMANSGLDPEFLKKYNAGSTSLASSTGTQPAADKSVDQSLLSGASLPTQPNVARMQRNQDIVNTNNTELARREALYHPSKLRQFMGGLAGVGAGIMSKNPMVGYGAYKGVTDLPKNDMASDTAEQNAPYLADIASQKDLAGIQSTYLQRLAEMSNANAKFNPNSSEVIAANARAKTADTGAKKWSYEQDHPETRNQEVGDPNVAGGKVPGVVGTRAGTVPFTSSGSTITPTPQRGFEPKQQMVELQDGSSVPAIYDPNTKKTANATTGEDITAKIKRVGELGDTNLKEYLDLWKQDFVQKNNRQPTPKEETNEIDKYRNEPGRASIILRDQMNNPTVADPEQVTYWAGKVTQDAKNFGLVPKKLKDAVSAELAKTGANINQIDAQTRDAAKFSNTALKHISTIEGLISNLEKRGQLGVVNSRWNDIMSRKIGADTTIQDKDLKNTFIALADNVGLLSTAMGRVHGGARGGSSPYMIEHLNKMVNSRTMDPDTLRSGLGVFKDWLTEYARMGGETMPGAEAPTTGGDATGWKVISVR